MYYNICYLICQEKGGDFLRLKGLFEIDAAFHRFQHDGCRACVGREGNGLHVTKAEQSGNVGLVGLCGQRVTQEDDEVKLPICEHRADLLIAAERTAFHAMDGKPRLAHDESTGRACRI